MNPRQELVTILVGLPTTCVAKDCIVQFRQPTLVVSLSGSATPVIKVVYDI